MKIKSLRVQNFMGFDEKEFSFDGNAIISGRNGSGKSTLLNAYYWLLFGCDQKLRDNPVVRRDFEGSATDSDVVVEFTFDNDGTVLALRKVQKRTFSKDGKSYKDDNKYFVNEVPVTLKSYNEKIGINLDVLKYSTSTDAFISLATKKMREAIFDMVGDITDLEVAKKSENDIIAEKLEAGYTVDEIKAMANATKTRCNKEIPQMDGMIAEAERLATMVIDVSASEKRKSEIESRISEIEYILQENATQIESVQTEIMAFNFEKNEIERMESEKLSKIKRDLQHEADVLFEQYTALKEKDSALRTAANDLARECNSRINLMKELKEKREELNNIEVDYSKISKLQSLKFDKTSTVCPVCNRKFAKSKIDEMVKHFEEDKQKKIDAETERCKSENQKILNEIAIISDKIGKLDVEISDLKIQRETIVSNIEEMQNDLLISKDDYLSKKKSAEAIDVMHPDMSQVFDYQILLKKITVKETVLKELKMADDRELRTEKSRLCDELLEVILAIKSADRTEYRLRYEELVSNKKDLVQAKADCEMVLDALDDLDKAKNEHLTDAINSKFSIVKWQMFEYAKNGNYKSVCVPTIDGKEILTIKCNKALRLIGLLDICTSIQKYYGIEVPIFIDDFESFDSENAGKVFENCKNQIICLKVSNNDLEMESL